jgi:hypothetical protein
MGPGQSVGMGPHLRLSSLYRQRARPAERLARGFSCIQPKSEGAAPILQRCGPNSSLSGIEQQAAIWSAGILPADAAASRAAALVRQTRIPALACLSFRRPFWAQVVASVWSIVSATRVTARDAVTSAGRMPALHLRASRAMIDEVPAGRRHHTHRGGGPGEVRDRSQTGRVPLGVTTSAFANLPRTRI